MTYQVVCREGEGGEEEKRRKEGREDRIGGGERAGPF